MPFQLGAKKAGLSLVRAFLHSIQGVKPALTEAAIKRNTVGYRFKTYKDGKVFTSTQIESLEDAFPCQGDKK